MKYQFILPYLAACLMTSPSFAAETDQSPLGKQMEAMNNAFKAFRSETDSAKGAAKAREAQAATLKSVLEAPSMLKSMPDGPAKAKALAEYHRMLGKLYVTFCEVEVAFLDSKFDEVAKIVGSIKEMKKAGHDRFIEE
jgi:hypothetical protein